MGGCSGVVSGDTANFEMGARSVDPSHNSSTGTTLSYVR